MSTRLLRWEWVVFRLLQAAIDNHYARGRRARIAEEAIHTAATAVRLLMNL